MRPNLEWVDLDTPIQKIYYNAKTGALFECKLMAEATTNKGISLSKIMLTKTKMKKIKHVQTVGGQTLTRYEFKRVEIIDKETKMPKTTTTQVPSKYLHDLDFVDEPLKLKSEKAQKEWQKGYEERRMKKLKQNYAIAPEDKYKSMLYNVSKKTAIPVTVHGFNKSREKAWISYQNKEGVTINRVVKSGELSKESTEEEKNMHDIVDQDLVADPGKLEKQVNPFMIVE